MNIHKKEYDQIKVNWQLVFLKAFFFFSEFFSAGYIAMPVGGDKLTLCEFIQ